MTTHTYVMFPACEPRGRARRGNEVKKVSGEATKAARIDFAPKNERLAVRVRRDAKVKELSDIQYQITVRASESKTRICNTVL